MKRKICFSVLICTLAFFIFFINTTSFEGRDYITGQIIEKGSNYVVLMNDNDSIITINNNINYNVGDYVGINYYGTINYLDKGNHLNIKSVILLKNPYDNEIMEYVKSLPIEKKIGQLIVSKVSSDSKELINKYHVSGLIYYAENIGKKTVEQIQTEIKNYQKNSDISLFIAIDEEGGTVSRVSHNKNLTKDPFLSPQELYNEGGFDKITADAIRKRDLLVNLGFNINYAPVIDVVTDTRSYMYQRSFGKNARQTAEFAKAILNTQNRELTYTLKHFPGYGNNTDTHQGKSYDYRTLSDFVKEDFIPYQEAINNGAKQIMVSHNIVVKIDNKPSSLSIKMHNILRESLHFKGVIITDSLSMKAITNNVINPYVEAVKAGNNLIITEQTAKTFNEIYEAYNNGQISEWLLNRLVYRVIELKKYKNLI